MAKRKLRELIALEVSIQTLCIQYPDSNVQCELKFGLIHLLPKFHGLVSENIHKHLKEFHIVCTTMRLSRVLKEHIKMKEFPFSLHDTTKD